MMWECTECRVREGTHIRPCQADTGVNSVPPAVCLLDPRGSNAKWRRIQLPSPKVARRKLRSVSILCLEDILTKGFGFDPEGWDKLSHVDPHIYKEADELACKVELALRGVRA